MIATLAAVKDHLTAPLKLRARHTRPCQEPALPQGSRGWNSSARERAARRAGSSVTAGDAASLVRWCALSGRARDDGRVPNISSSAGGVRLAELLAVLSLGADLGMNQPMEHVLRQSLIALRLGELLGFDEAARAGLYHSSLIVWVGCHIDAYEQAKWFGDDLALKGDFRVIDATGAAPLKYLAGHLGAGRPLLARARMGVRFVAGGHRDVDGMLANHWYAADTLARRLGLGQEVCDTIGQTFERWDGKGSPHGTKGEDLLLPARIVALADVIEVYHRTSGDDGAVSVARERSGTQFDPALVDLGPRRRCCSRIWTWPPAGGP